MTENSGESQFIKIAMNRSVADGACEFYVKTLTGKTITIIADPLSTTINDIKDMI